MDPSLPFVSLERGCSSCEPQPGGGICVQGSNNAHSLMMPPGDPGSGNFCPAPNLTNSTDYRPMHVDCVALPAEL